MKKIVRSVSRSQIPVFVMEQQFQAKNGVHQQNFPIYFWRRKQLTDFFFHLNHFLDLEQQITNRLIECCIFEFQPVFLVGNRHKNRVN